MTSDLRIRTALAAYTAEGLIEGWESDEQPFTTLYRVAFSGFTREWDTRQVTAFIEGVNAARTPTERRLFA